MGRLLSLLFCLCLSFNLQAQDIYDIEQITEIRITFERSDWAKALDSLKQLGTKERLVADVEVNGVLLEGVGVRYKGNSSYFNVKKTGSVKLPFNIKADHTTKGQTFPGGYQTLKLSNVFRDPSFLREALSYEIARQYMPAPRCNFARVFVNDVFLGLYNNTESINDFFLENHFGTSSGTLFKCDPEWQAETRSYCPEGDKASLMFLGDNPNCYMGKYELKSKKGWSDLVALTQTLNEDPESLDTILNIDHALWMLAFNSVLVNLDSYTGRLSHNYYIFRLPNGQFSTLLWDMNLSFGGFRFAGTEKSLNNEELQTLSPFLHYKTKNPKRPLITNLLSNSLYRKIYLGHMRTILEDHFANGNYLQRMNEIQDVIRTEVENDPNRLYDMEGFGLNPQETVLAGRSEIIGIAELMEARVIYLQAHPVFKGPAPAISEVMHTKYGPTLAFTATITNSEKAYLAYRLNPDDAFTMVEMFDDSRNNDEMAGDNVWGITLDFQQGIEYYIIAEGERNAMLSPERASYEFYKVD